MHPYVPPGLLCVQAWSPNFERECWCEFKELQKDCCRAYVLELSKKLKCRVGDEFIRLFINLFLKFYALAFYQLGSRATFRWSLIVLHLASLKPILRIDLP